MKEWRVKEMEDEIEDLRAEIVSLNYEVNYLENLNSDLVESYQTRLKNCINCKHRKWCKEIPVDFLACHDWDWED